MNSIIPATTSNDNDGRATTYSIDHNNLNYKWILRGNIIVPTDNPFSATVEVDHQDNSDANNTSRGSSNVQWLGPGLKLLIDHVMAVDHSGIIQIIQPYDTFLTDRYLNENEWDVLCSKKYDDPSQAEMIQLHNMYEFICPGMIDLHIHAPQYSYTGTATDRPLMGQDGWLETYTFPSEQRLKEDMSYTKHVYSSVIQSTLRHGTTTAVYFATLDIEPCKVLVDCSYQYGQRTYIGKVCMDRNSPKNYCQSLEQNIQETKELIQYISDTNNKYYSNHTDNNKSVLLPLVTPIITPRFIPTCTPHLLQELGQLAIQYNCPITSHLSESYDEVEYTQYIDEVDQQQQQSDNNSNNHNATSKRTDTMIFDSYQLLHQPCIMAHGVHISYPTDYDRLRLRGTAIAHCPLSNFYFANDILPCRQLMECNNKVGLGTDVAGGYNCSMFHSARMAVIASHALEQQQQKEQRLQGSSATVDDSQMKERKSAILDYKHSYYLATLGGAVALNIQDRVGTLMVGMEFDAIILSAKKSATTTSPVQIFDRDTRSDIFQKLLVLGDDRNISRVFVQGNDVTVAS